MLGNGGSYGEGEGESLKRICIEFYKGKATEKFALVDCKQFSKKENDVEMTKQAHFLPCEIKTCRTMFCNQRFG